MTFHPDRLRKEIISLEEAAWLIIGLAFGWFVGKGATVLILTIPLAIFAVWIYELMYAQKYGEKTMYGKPARKR